MPLPDAAPARRSIEIAIVGDGKYGGRAAFPEALARRAPAAKTLQLLARELALPDPEAGTNLRVTAPLPPHMAATWRALGFEEGRGEGALQALLAYAEGLSHSPARGQRPLPAKGGRRPL